MFCPMFIHIKHSINKHIHLHNTGLLLPRVVTFSIHIQYDYVWRSNGALGECFSRTKSIYCLIYR